MLTWLPSIGISGLIFYTGDTFPQWKGHLFVGGLSGLALHRLAFNEKGGLLGREALLTRCGSGSATCGRVRTGTSTWPSTPTRAASCASSRSRRASRPQATKLINVGLRPTPRLGRLRGPNSPRRSLAGAPCAPPLCGNENSILVASHNGLMRGSAPHPGSVPPPPRLRRGSP